MRFAASGVSVILITLGSLALCDKARSQPSTVLTYQKVSSTEGNLVATIDNLDEFGGAVVGLGDLDGAGPSAGAVAVGVIGDDDGGSGRGAVYILFLASNGTVLSNQKISDLAGNFTALIDNVDEFGSSLAYLGDLDGAGPSVAALAVGTVGDDDGGTNRGAVYILFLASNGTVLSFQKISDTAGNFTPIIDNGDEFGGTVAGLGDLDGAGPSVAALAVGAVGDDDGGADRGAVYILFLASNGTVLSHQKISDLEGGFTGVIDDLDQFGSAVTSLGDLDLGGPSALALAIGVVGDDDGGGDRGAVYILFLASNGSVLSHQKISNLEGGFTAVLDDLDEFGGALSDLCDFDAVGPVFGPSAAALAVGAIGDDDGGIDRGAVYMLFLTRSGTVWSYQKISDTEGNFTAPMDDGDDFGGTLACIGDLDGVGASAQTLVIGAAGDDDGGGARGAVYVTSLVGFTLTDAPAELPGAPRNILGRARPNPFNPRTTIHFQIAATGLVQIDILDAHGRLVRQLVRKMFEPGAHEAGWDGLDDRGRSLASGAYFYRMSVNGQAVDGPGKVVLLK
ncbi:MAG TPA: FlgD immunoglobulin-like domain containing protein [Candidatus Krumholzibacteria bacterium]|nr:FlgD immunoglobulin-like domain containing protein [Candidatus Krumholzibacteria bacterium]